MNIDFGLFHLSIAVRSMPKTNSSAPVAEPHCSSLPEIDYALLSRTLSRLSPPPRVSGRRELLKTLDAELFHTLAEEEKTIDRRERLRLLTAALATQVVGCSFRFAG